MAGNVKGITIEFRGETTKLDKALRKVGDETRSIDKELKGVNNALKFNPTSIELWRQKQQLLTKKVEETKEKLSLLKQQQAQMDASGVDKNSQEYRKLQREIIVATNQVENFEGQLKKVGNINMKAAAAHVKDLGNKLTSAGEAMRGLSAAGAIVAGSVGVLAYKSGLLADDLNTMSKQYHINTRDLQQYSVAADLVDVSTETIAQTHVRLEKSMASASDGTGAAADAFAKLGVNVTNADGSLRGGDEVWQETIKALGNVANETDRDTLAMQLMGKSASELNPLIADGGETYKNVADTLQKYHLDFIDQETLDKANQFNDQLDVMKAMGLVALQSVGAELAGYLAPALEKVVGWAGKLAEWIGGLDPKVLTLIGTIGALLAAAAPLLIGLGKVAFAINSIIELVSVIGPAVAGLTGPIGIAIAAVAAAIAIGVALYKNWDKIKAAAGKLKKAVVNAFKEAGRGLINAISAWFDIITAPFRAAWGLIKKIAAKIRDVFNFDFKLPDIKTPHFYIDPKGWQIGDLLDGVIPTLGIDWHKDGAIFKRPTIIGRHGFGEAGAEAAVPLDPFWDRLDMIGTQIADSVVNGVMTAMALQGAGSGGPVIIENYLYKSGPQLGETIVREYDKYKKILG